MPMFTTNSKIAAKQLAEGIAQLGVAISFEVNYDDNYGLGKGFWSIEGQDDPELRESFVNWVLEEEQHDEEESDDWHEGYEKYREEEYEAQEDYYTQDDNTLECPM